MLSEKEKKLIPLLKIKRLEQAYVSCFNTYKSGWKISDDILGYYHNDFLDYIHKYPEYFEKRGKQPNTKSDTHRAKIDPLIDIIDNRINLTKEEKRLITNIHSKNSFRKIID